MSRRYCVQMYVSSPADMGIWSTSAFVLLSERYCLTEARDLIPHLRPGSLVQIFFTEDLWPAVVRSEGNWSFISPPEV